MSYQSHELGNKQLAIGYWFVTHRIQLRRFGILALGCLAAVLVSYGAYGLLKFYVFEDAATRAWQEELTLSKLAHEQYVDIIKAQDLTISSVGMMRDGANSDVYAKIVNPNERWYATFTYHFRVGGYTSPTFSGFALPQEEKILTGFSLDPSPEEGNAATFVFESISWKRISAHAIPDYLTWAGERLRIAVDDLEYEPPTKLHENSPLVVSRVQFTAENESIYDYWQVKFLIIGMRDGKPVALQQKVISPFVSQERATQVVSWFGNITRFDSVTIEPEVDILDPESYWQSRKGVIGVEE